MRPSDALGIFGETIEVCPDVSVMIGWGPRAGFGDEAMILRGRSPIGLMTSPPKQQFSTGTGDETTRCSELGRPPGVSQFATENHLNVIQIEGDHF